MKHKFNQPPRMEVGQNVQYSAVPQNILECVHNALLPYITSWDKVRDAILSPAHENRIPDSEEEIFLSTEELGSILHVTRVTLFRYKTAGKIHAYKLGRRNLYSLREIKAALKDEKVTVPRPDNSLGFDF